MQLTLHRECHGLDILRRSIGHYDVLVNFTFKIFKSSCGTEPHYYHSCDILIAAVAVLESPRIAIGSRDSRIFFPPVNLPSVSSIFRRSSGRVLRVRRSACGKQERRESRKKERTTRRKARARGEGGRRRKEMPLTYEIGRTTSFAAPREFGYPASIAAPGNARRAAGERGEGGGRRTRRRDAPCCRRYCVQRCTARERVTPGAR